MRRTALPVALVLAVIAAPAAAVDLGRLLPMPEVSLPDWLAGETPKAVDSAAPRSDAAAAQPGAPSTSQAAPAPTGPLSAKPPSKPALRPRGWRSLLPGSIK